MALSPYARFKSNKEAELDGLLFSPMEGVRFLVARAGGRNESFKRAFAQKTKPFRHQIQNETLSDEKSNELMAEVYAETVIKGWESQIDGDWKPVLLDENGKEMPFTKANFCKVMRDLPELFRQITTFANDASVFLEQDEAEDAGNSQSASDGTSSGEDDSTS